MSFPVQDGGRILSIEGGTVRNAVCARATAVVRAERGELCPDGRIEVEGLGDGRLLLRATGIGGHAAMPQGMLSALGVLCRCLLASGVCNQAERRWLRLQTMIHDMWDGSALGVDATDDVFDPLTIISGTMRMEAGHFVQTMDARYPKSTTPDRLGERLRAICEEHGARFVETHRGGCLYVDPSRPELRALLESYAEWTGQEPHAVTMGGGTYAKRFPLAVAFGPENGPDDVGLPDWVGPIHGPNEAVRETSLRRALAIYISALGRLLG